MTKDIMVGHRTRIDGEWRVKHETNENAPSFSGAEVSSFSNKVMIPLSHMPAFMLALKAFKPFVWMFEQDRYTLKIDKNVIFFLSTLVSIYVKLHPGVVAEFDDDINNCTYARLLILQWWVKYAHKTYGRSARLEVS